MNETRLLLRAYYEILYDRLLTNKELLIKRIEEILPGEISEFGFEDFNDEKYAAYMDACIAFMDERIEAYNPIGIQYTFDQTRARDAFELELQLDWYDSRAEYENLVAAARREAQSGGIGNEPEIPAAKLIEELGAFPDKSIICAYEDEPNLRKLPDYIVARVIEEIIK
ncbi:MAG: hypothetical protein JW837_14795 [Sedimentisphaerales bacterium]|nr:hypothetical protein [Sedimentisphaerales bacterium]